MTDHTGYVHRGTRSWWDGSVTTLCGLRIPQPRSVWWPTKRDVCPACARIKAQAGTR